MANIKPSFEETVQKNETYIKSVIRKFKTFNKTEVEDIYQNFIYDLWVCYNKFDKDKSNFSTFFYKKLIWVCISYKHCRKKIHYIEKDIPYRILDNEFSVRFSQKEQIIVDLLVSGHNKRETSKITGIPYNQLLKICGQIREKYAKENISI